VISAKLFEIAEPASSPKLAGDAIVFLYDLPANAKKPTEKSVGVAFQ
jgi:hypothetical protein